MRDGVRKRFRDLEGMNDGFVKEEMMRVVGGTLEKLEAWFEEMVEIGEL